METTAVENFLIAGRVVALIKTKVMDWQSRPRPE